MSQENAALARRWFEEVWNQRKVEAIDALSAPDSIGHLADEAIRTREEFKALHAEFLAALPDLEIEVEQTLAHGDDVVVRWSARGSHRGLGFGCPATGEEIGFHGLTWMRFRDGQIQEAWDGWNLGALMARLRGDV